MGVRDWGFGKLDVSGHGDVLQCGALLLTHFSTVMCCPKAFGKVPPWSTCFKHVTEAGEVPRQPLSAEQSQPPASEQGH